MSQSEFLAITGNLRKEREKSRVQGAIGFRFASRWLKNWREIFKPITKSSNSKRNYFRQSFEDCSNFIGSWWCRNTQCLLVQSHPASPLTTPSPLPKLKWKVISYVMLSRPKRPSMVAWHLSGWYGCTHACGDGHITRLVQHASTLLYALLRSFSRASFFSLLS